MNKNHTEIVCIMDESGSMEDTRDAAIDGFNKFVKEQQQGPGTASMTLVMFNNTWQKKFLCEDIGNVQPLDRSTYKPNGGTALNDAIGHSIDTIGEVAKASGSKVIFLIITDGGENASQDYDNKKIKALISAKEADGWKFVYVGANVDVFAEAAARGLNKAGTISTSYASTNIGTHAAYEVMTASVSTLRGSTGKADLDEKWLGLKNSLEANVVKSNESTAKKQP